MKLSNNELKMFTPTGNRVLVRSIVKTNVVNVGGQQLHIDTSFKPEFHQQVICEVISTPKKLIFDRKRPVGESMEWDTRMELRKGDVVWCNYLAVIKGKEDFLIECEGIEYFLVDYERIYLKKEGRKVKMLNGWVLCEPAYVEQKEIKVRGKTVHLPQLTSASEKEGHAKPTLYGTVRHLGRPITHYHSEHAVADDDYIRQGDVIQFVAPNNVRLEHNLHRQFSGGDEMIVTRRSRMVAIVEFENTDS